MIMAMAVGVARKERPRARACGATLALDCKRENACLRVPGAPSQTGWVGAGGKRKRGESFSSAALFFCFHLYVILDWVQCRVEFA